MDQVCQTQGLPVMIHPPRREGETEKVRLYWDYDSKRIQIIKICPIWFIKRKKSLNHKVGAGKSKISRCKCMHKMATVATSLEFLSKSNCLISITKLSVLTT